MMNAVRVLTDIRIAQCSRWGQATSIVETRGLDRLKPLFPRLAEFVLPLMTLIKILRQMRQYDVVITAHIRSAHLFGVVRRLLRIRSPKHIILELMLDEERSHIGWRLKKMVQQWCFSAVDCVFVSSTSEIETYSLRLNIPRERVRFLPFHSNVVVPHLVTGDGNYILAAGRTGRDYGVLLEAVRGLGVEVRIVSDDESISDLDIPPHVKVFTNIEYSSYLGMLRNCRFVVVPLKKLVKSTGQVVILEAMALGKPVIATRTTGTVDYIQSGITGILVPPDDHGGLREAIVNLLDDPMLHLTIAKRALESVEKNHTFERYVETILETACDLSKL